MNEELNNTFNEYIEKFKELDVADKRVEVINSIKEFNAIIEGLAELENSSLVLLKSKEILEFNNGLESEDDFLEALLVYIENAKNSFGQYILKDRD